MLDGLLAEDRLLGDDALDGLLADDPLDSELSLEPLLGLLALLSDEPLERPEALEASEPLDADEALEASEPVPLDKSEPLLASEALEFGGLLELEPPPIAMLRAIGVPVADAETLAPLVWPASFLRTAASCWISASTKTADIRCRTMVLP